MFDCLLGMLEENVRTSLSLFLYQLPLCGLEHISIILQMHVF